MRAILLWISMLMLAAAVHAQSSQDSLFSFQGDMLKYNMSIQRDALSITGICLMKRSDGRILGSVVNEFGIKAFDFTYDTSKRKVKLQNVVGFINKWYIRKVLKGDLRYLFSYRVPAQADPHRTLTVSGGGIIDMKNTKYRLEYRFEPLTDVKEEKEQ